MRGSSLRPMDALPLKTLAISNGEPNHSNWCSSWACKQLSQLSCPISMEIAFYKPMNQSESQCIPPGWSANAFWTPLILRIGVCYQSLSLNMVVLSPLWSVVESTLWGMQCIRCLYSTVFYWLSNINWYSLTGLQLLNSWTALWLSILRSCIRANGVQASRAFYQRDF